MTPSPTRTRAAGGLLAGLAVCSAAIVALPAGDAPMGPAHAAHVQADELVQPSAVAVVPRLPRRASRGGLRTAPALTRYVTKTVPIGSSFSGAASWYGGSFQGRRTANGEHFDTNELTAASRTLPFGTRLRVCRRSHCVLVRVNDRGPYVGGRVLDLSRAASNALGYDGVAFVTATPVARRRVAVHAAPQTNPHAAPRRPVRPAVRQAGSRTPPVAPASAVPASTPRPVEAAGSAPHPGSPELVAGALGALVVGGTALGRRCRRHF